MDNNGLKVLVVDDDAEVRGFLTELLEAEGHSVVTATNGLEGVLKAKDNIDIAILDLNMPIFDGLSVCKTLKEDPETEHIPVVFLTGYNDQKILNDCGNSGNAVMRKPVKCGDLLSKIAELMAGRFALA